MIVNAVISTKVSPTGSPLGDAVETVLRRVDAERFIEEVRGDDPELVSFPAYRGARARGRRAQLASRWARRARSVHRAELAVDPKQHDDRLQKQPHPQEPDNPHHESCEAR